MVYLKKSLATWNSRNFENSFKSEVCVLTMDELLLQKALKYGSHAINENIKVMINHREEQAEWIVVHAGIFFTSVIAGCNCADDPTPQDSYSEYCELSFRIGKINAKTSIKLLD